MKQILYVDDDPDDREFFREAVENTNPEFEVVQAENGLAALDYLSAIDNPLMMPSLIVLDINMPYLDGRETYQRIKNNDALQKVPVAVLSSSEKPGDKALFNKMGVAYFIKPVKLSYLADIAKSMVQMYCG